MPTSKTQNRTDTSVRPAGRRPVRSSEKARMAVRIGARADRPDTSCSALKTLILHQRVPQRTACNLFEVHSNATPLKKYKRRMAPAKMEDQLTLVGRTLEEESSRKREEIEARHARELRELLRAQAKELKEFEISAQEKKEAKLNEVKEKFQGEKVENITIQQEEKAEKKGHGKINSCPACNEVPCHTNNVQLRPCECCDIVDNLSRSLCDGCADKMNLKAALCGNWTCNACHERHVQGCRLCEADEGEGWFMGNQ